MNDQSLDWLTALTPVGEATLTWGVGQMRLRSYATNIQPPSALVTSIRCIVLHADTVLVMRNKDGRHIWPGGRREGDESPEQTIRRELMEEAGCTVAKPVYLGFLHLRHLGPKPPNHPYLYPDFFQPIYAAHLLSHDPTAAHLDDYELESSFLPATVVRSEITELGEPAFLDAALHALRPPA